jgi:hypothetical protein
MALFLLMLSVCAWPIMIWFGYMIRMMEGDE